MKLGVAAVRRHADSQGGQADQREAAAAHASRQAEARRAAHRNRRARVPAHLAAGVERIDRVAHRVAAALGGQSAPPRMRTAPRARPR